MVNIAITLLLCLLVIVAYMVIRAILRRIFKYHDLGLKMVRGLEKALLFFCLEIALFISLEFFTFTALPLVRHLLVILFILTIGYLLICMARVLHHVGVNKYSTEE